jgi:hypothetical protein
VSVVARVALFISSMVHNCFHGANRPGVTSISVKTNISVQLRALSKGLAERLRCCTCLPFI